MLLLSGVFLLSLCGHSASSTEDFESVEERTFEEDCVHYGVNFNEFMDPITFLPKNCFPESPDIFVEDWYKNHKVKIRGFKTFMGKKVTVTYKFPDEENEKLKGTDKD